MDALLSFLKSNVIAICAIIISFLAFVVAIKNYRHRSRARLRVEVNGNWNFDCVVEEEWEPEDLHGASVYFAYKIVNRGKVGEVIVKNLGGVGTTLEAVYVLKKTFRGNKRVIIPSGMELIPFCGTKIEPGDKITAGAHFDVPIFEFLFKNGLFDLTKQDQGQFKLALKNIFGREGRSNTFRVVLSPSSLRFLQLGCNKSAFISEYKEERGLESSWRERDSV